MNFLVLSKQHHLLPFAQRLKREGHDVETIVYGAGNRAKYEAAYSGVIEFALQKGQKGRQEKLQTLVEAAAGGLGVVLTDDLRAARDFRSAAYIYPRLKETEAPKGPLRLGAWFNGEQFVAPHLLVVDEGLMPGGLGADCESGLTLVRLNVSHLTEMDSLVDDLKSRSFRGLCQWGLRVESGRLDRDMTQLLGWPSLHTHAFVSELEDFGGLLTGAEVVLPKKYVVVSRLTQPPWPYPVMHSHGQVPIEGLNDEQSGQVFWHDVGVNQTTRTMGTAGLDGMVGVARGAAGSCELAQARCMAIAQAATFPEKQYRTDTGSRVRHALALLEEQLGLEV